MTLEKNDVGQEKTSAKQPTGLGSSFTLSTLEQQICCQNLRDVSNQKKNQFKHSLLLRQQQASVHVSIPPVVFILNPYTETCFP